MRPSAPSAGGNWALARYDLDGTLDETFGWGGKMTSDFGTNSDRALNVSVRPDGKIVLMGLVCGAGDNYQFAIARYTTLRVPGCQRVLDAASRRCKLPSGFAAVSSLSRRASSMPAASQR